VLDDLLELELPGLELALDLGAEVVGDVLVRRAQAVGRPDERVLAGRAREVEDQAVALVRPRRRTEASTGALDEARPTLVGRHIATHATSGQS
jgi:hypothetical protein